MKTSKLQRSLKSLAFWLQPTFPQYRKVVNGKEKLLDGTETSRTKIRTYDYSDDYKAWREFVMSGALKKYAKKLQKKNPAAP